jgi:acetyl esterase/lipase
MGLPEHTGLLRMIIIVQLIKAAMKKIIRVMLLLIIATHQMMAQQVIPLYKEAIPNSLPNTMKEITLEWDGHFGGYKSIARPTLEIYLPPAGKGNGAAVIICPGGGYGMESYLAEGLNIAKTFINHGVAAFILKYRLPSDSTMPNKSIGPLQDAQQAIKQVRENAAAWHVNPDKIGIMGFSAGGHLAASAATHFEKALIPNPANTSLRPDFAVLVYPVISMTNQLGHQGSRKNLLGERPDSATIHFFSNEKNVHSNTPPVWITHSEEDKVVDVENSIFFYQALRREHVPVEMHLYPKGDHGFVLSIPTETWMRPLFEWMTNSGW